MRILAIALTVALLMAGVQCVIACAAPPDRPQAAPSCHQRQQPAPAHAPQSCAHALVIDLAPSPARAELAETGVLADEVAPDFELKSPQFIGETPCRDISPPVSSHPGLCTVLKI